jgi:hypothetical protein
MIKKFIDANGFSHYFKRTISLIEEKLNNHQHPELIDQFKTILDKIDINVTCITQEEEFEVKSIQCDTNQISHEGGTLNFTIIVGRIDK